MPLKRKARMNDQALEHLLRQGFRLDTAPTLAVPTPAKVPIAFTHLRCAVPEYGRARPVPAKASFAVQVLLRPMRCWEIWSNRGRARLPASGPGSIFLFDLTENPQMDVRDPFDMVRFYISQSSLDSLAYEHDQRRVAGLRVPEIGTYDPVMRGMASALAANIQRPREVSSMFAEHMALAFYAHVSHAYGGVSLDRRHSGGLTNWQTRRACEVMQSELDANHSANHLIGAWLPSAAFQAGISQGPSSRPPAFRRTSGCCASGSSARVNSSPIPRWIWPPSPWPAASWTRATFLASSRASWEKLPVIGDANWLGRRAAAATHPAKSEPGIVTLRASGRGWAAGAG